MGDELKEKKMDNVNELISEMMDEFLMSEACSRYYALAGNDNHEAQDLDWYIKYDQHAILCGQAALACEEYLNTKDKKRLIFVFAVLGLHECIYKILKSEYE